MSWRDPSLLWLLLLVPLAFAAIMHQARRRRAALRRFSLEANHANLLRGGGGGLRALRAGIWLLALGFFLVALAGPRYGGRTRLLRKRGVDLVIALDFSKSMLAQDVRPNRIDRAKAEIQRLLEELEGDRVGMVAFAGDTIEYPMTVDDSAVTLFLRDLGPYDMPVGGTAIGRALVAADRLLTRAREHRQPAEEVESEEGVEAEPSQVVILFTDGEDHEGDPEAAADTLAEHGVVLHTVGIGSRVGEPIPTYSSDGTWTGYLRDESNEVVTTAFTEENERQLRDLAETTGGTFFRAERGSVGVREVRAMLRAMRQAEQESRRITVYEDRYVLAALPAFFLFLLESLLPEVWLRRRRRVLPAADEKGESR